MILDESIVCSIDSQPGCLEPVPAVPPIHLIPEYLYLFDQLGVPRDIYIAWLRFHKKKIGKYWSIAVFFNLFQVAELHK